MFVQRFLFLSTGTRLSELAEMSAVSLPGSSASREIWVLTWVGFGEQGLGSIRLRASLGGSMVKKPPAKQETQVQSLGRKDPLEKEMATHSSVLAWRIPWTEEPGGLQPIGSKNSWIRLSN